MAMALDPTQYQKSWRDFLNQTQAATGRSSTPQELTAYRTGELEAEYQQTNTERDLAMKQQQLGINQQAANTSQQSVNQQGTYQTGQLAIGEAGAYAQQKQATAAQKAGMYQSALTAPTGALSIYGLGKSAGIWGQAAAGGRTINPIAEGATQIQGAGMGATGAFDTGAMQGAADTFAGDVMGEGAGAAAGVGAYATPVGAGLVGGKLGAMGGEAIGGALGIGGKNERDIAGGVVGGAAAGAAVGAFGGPLDPITVPVGGIIGGIVGGVSQAVGTVICTELHRQGRMTDELYKVESKFGVTLPLEAMAGYRRWASHVVRGMRRSRVITDITYGLTYHVIKEMAHRVEPESYQPSLIGSFVLFVGIPLCMWLGQRETEMEVSHARV